MKNSLSLRGALVFAFVLLVPALGAAQETYPGPATLTGGQPFDPPIEGPPIDCNNMGNPVADCGFEAGFGAWVPTDMAAPFVPLQVIGAGYSVGFGFFATTPTEGAMVAFNGFDGGGPDTIQLGQDVMIPMGGDGTLTFDYRGAWDMTFGATLDRTFEVTIEPAGGGPPMQTDLILTANPNTTIVDTGPLSAVVDVTPYTGQTVFVNFVWTIPENFTGPGQFQVDNVNIAVEPGGMLPIPTLGRYGLLALIGLLLLFGLRFIYRSGG